jgi:hypothetical protein
MEMSVEDAIQEVLGGFTPIPTTVALRVRVWYEGTAQTVLSSTDDYVSFVHVVLAAAYAPPTSWSHQGLMGIAVGAFCRNHNLVVRGYGQ